MKYRPEEKIEYDEVFFTKEPYDKFAHCKGQGIFKEQVDMLIEVFGSFSNKKVLDVGGALGWLAVRFLDVGADAYCQEVSEWACKNSPITNRMFCQDAGEGLLFDDSTFDYVVSIEALEHVDNVRFALKEISRVLKPGGYFYCSVGYSDVMSHIHVGNDDDWVLLLDAIPDMKIDWTLTRKIRMTRLCSANKWHAFILIKSWGE